MKRPEQKFNCIGELLKEAKKRVKNDCNKEVPGGYMAIYHDIEEICYGPESGFPEIMRVFLCIRHKLLRDGLGQKQITYRFISEKTGLEKRNIIPCIKKLQKNGFIIITQNKVDLGNGRFQYHENSYSLNPKKFGDLYNWYKNNPTVRVYNGSSVGSYSKKGVVPNERLPLVSNERPGVVSDQTLGNDLKLSELLSNSSCKNPIKEPLRKEPLLEEVDFISRERDREEAEKAKMMIHGMVGNIMKGMK